MTLLKKIWIIVIAHQKEKKQLYVKYKSTETAGILDEYELNENEDGTFRQFEMYENISEFIQNYENAKKAKKIKKTVGVEKFADKEIVEWVRLQF